ncbi:MAG: hypothetical protein SFZ23_11820 [Planctomycetota bacterium]|nr:hypothetical protein [Planctomycetota bacterium]
MNERELLSQVLDEDVLIPTLLAFGLVTVFTFKIIAGLIESVARERTRRDIAAFIAEGSMTPEQGERLLRAGEKKKNS